MPDFISKVQYKNCEDGEYYDEQPRNLQQTLELIEKYPWEREQYADLALTGPSITIQSPRNDFLRLGIYYGGKFTLHYLDTKHHHYIRKNITMELATDAIATFFSGNLSLSEFEKHSMAYITKYFLTKSFEYRFRVWRILLFTLDWLVLFILFACFSAAALFSKAGGEIAALLGAVAFGFGAFIIVVFNKLFRVRKQYLRISRGNNKFLFGDDPDDIKEYDKRDIVKLITYDNTSGKRYRRINTLLQIYEIDFSDGMFIRFNNILISDSYFELKFSDKWKFEREKIGMNSLDLFREL